MGHISCCPILQNEKQNSYNCKRKVAFECKSTTTKNFLSKKQLMFFLVFWILQTSFVLKHMQYFLQVIHNRNVCQLTNKLIFLKSKNLSFWFQQKDVSLSKGKKLDQCFKQKKVSKNIFWFFTTNSNHNLKQVIAKDVAIIKMHYVWQKVLKIFFFQILN